QHAPVYYLRECGVRTIGPIGLAAEDRCAVMLYRGYWPCVRFHRSSPLFDGPNMARVGLVRKPLSAAFVEKFSKMGLVRPAMCRPACPPSPPDCILSTVGSLPPPPPSARSRQR